MCATCLTNSVSSVLVFPGIFLCITSLIELDGTRNRTGYSIEKTCMGCHCYSSGLSFSLLCYSFCICLVFRCNINERETWEAAFKRHQFQIFYLEWETVKTSEPVKETVQTTQSPAAVEKETVVTTQSEVFPPPVTMLQVSTSCLLSGLVPSHLILFLRNSWRLLSLRC